MSRLSFLLLSAVLVLSGAKAVKVGCKARDFRKYYVNMIKAYTPLAGAMVGVWSSSVAGCDTYGPNVFGCAKATSRSKASSKALIAVFSSAFAKAMRKCKRCRYRKIYISEFSLAKLIAKASSYTKAKVCVGPNETASAEAYSLCASQILARGFAKATAKVMINRRCTYFKPWAIVKVKNEIRFKRYCACVGWACINKKCTKWRYKPGKYKYKRMNPFAKAYFKQECKAYAKMYK